MIRILLFITLILYSYVAYAGLEEELQRTFELFNSSANISGGGAYKGQEGGYYTGGGAYIRNPSRSVCPVNFQLPSVSAGCNGIDLHMGAFSFINSQKLVETLKAIGANATSYTFALALKQMSPQIMNQIEEIQAKLAWANEMNLNSCNMAKMLVNNGASLLEDSNVGACIRKVQSENTDYHKAREECQAQEKVNSKNREAKAAGQPTIDNINIVWDLMQKNRMLHSLDQHTKQLLMTLTGTIVFKTEPGKPAEPHFYSSKLHSHELIAGLADGKQFKMYSCEDPECLNIADQETTLKKEATFVGQVTRILQAIEEKIIKDEGILTPQEKGFLELTRLPVYKMLNVQAGFYKGMAFFTTKDYADVIAMDVLHAFIDNGISDIMSTNKNGLIPKEYLDQFNNMVTQARQRAMELRMMQVKKTGTINDMIAKVQMMETKVAALISNQLVH